MKINKSKLLVFMILTTIMMIGWANIRTSLTYFFDGGKAALQQKGESKFTEKSRTDHTSKVPDFNGENFSVLPKNERMIVSLKKHTDGDTSQFILGGHKVKVRYLLIDTPETVKPNTEPQPYGYEASNRTKELLQDANKIEIMLDRGDRTDHYNRVLAYVFVDGELIQDILLSEGLARLAYIREPNTTYLEELKASEEQAKHNRIGIWSVDGYVTEKGFEP